MPKVNFNNSNRVFFTSLKASVDSYFAENGIKKTGNIALYTKTIVLVLGAAAMYALFLFVPMSLPLTIVLSMFFGFILACIGFNVMHDANHGSYSSRKWVNDTMALTLNALGSNSFIWKQKHNVIHHTYTNIDGMDDDIAKSPFIRMCSTQVWKPAHRLQHIYVPFLYAISSMIWILVQDFEKYFRKKIVNTTLNKMSVSDHLIFWISKALYIFFYIAVPMMLMGWQSGLLFFVSMHVGLGITLSIVFQLAHVVEETEFEVVGTDTKQIDNEWAIHQIKTTANFSPRNAVISWFAGGLNYQIEHHLFPRISHVHYPAISKLVEAECAAFGLPYNSLPSFGSAVNSHFRFIKTLGQKPQLG